jgi:hypothetical protein
MVEFICRMSLTAFLLVYSVVFLGLLGRSIHRELRRWLKKVRRARALSAIGRLAISSPPRVH